MDFPEGLYRYLVITCLTIHVRSIGDSFLKHISLGNEYTLFQFRVCQNIYGF